MSRFFYIQTKELADLSLKLQRINDVALPFAVQNTLNRVARDVKINSLKQTTNKMFTIRKRTFFTANSGYKSYKAKQFGYNINRLKAEIGITKSVKPNEKATEQVGSQQTATNIKRSINPLGEKSKPKSVINILSKKPEVYDSQADNGEFAYIRTVQKAYRSNTGVIFKKGNRGALHRITNMKKRKPTKKNPNKFIIKTIPIASYIKSGEVKLTKKRPFLNDAVIMSSNKLMERFFIEEANKQIERVRRK